MTDPDRDETAHAQSVLAHVVDEWIARRGVVSVELARRWIDGRPTEQVAIRVTVERKLPADQVPAGELFPKSLGGVPIQIVEGHRPTLDT